MVNAAGKRLGKEEEEEEEKRSMMERWLKLAV